jgi:hypothetical protein
MNITEDKRKLSKDRNTITREVKIVEQGQQITEKIEYTRNRSPRVTEIGRKSTQGK